MVGAVTKRAVDALGPARANTFLWDRDLSRFGVECTPETRGGAHDSRYWRAAGWCQPPACWERAAGTNSCERLRAWRGKGAVTQEQVHSGPADDGRDLLLESDAREEGMRRSRSERSSCPS